LGGVSLVSNIKANDTVDCIADYANCIISASSSHSPPNDNEGTHSAIHQVTDFSFLSALQRFPLLRHGRRDFKHLPF